MNGNHSSHHSGLGRLEPAELLRFLEDAPDGIAIFDASFHCIASNSEFQRLNGVERSRDLHGLSLANFFTELDRAAVETAVKQLRSSGRVRFEGDMLQASGPVIPVEVTGICRPYDAGWGQLHFRDVSERRRIDQLKDDFISVVNHELRTPLTSISGSLGLILGGVAGEVPEQARALAQVAHKNCQRLGRLIDDMLDVQKIESGRVDFSMGPVELVGTVFSAVEANRNYAARFQVEIDARAEVERAPVRADADRIEQVVANLLSNAAKYSPPGETVLVRVEETAAGYRVTVSDRGKGIPEQFQSRVFAKFAQADTSTTRKKGGTGLGLAISKAIIEGMNGTIGFRTSHGKGTSFWFDLPLMNAADTAVEIETGAIVLVGDGTKWSVPEGVRLQPVHDSSGASSFARTSNSSTILVDIDRADAGDVLASVRRAGDLDEVAVKFCVIDESREAAALELASWLPQPLDPGRLASALRGIQLRRGVGRLRVVLVGSPKSVADVNAAILSPLGECTVAHTPAEVASDLLDSPEMVLVLDSARLADEQLAAIAAAAVGTQASVVLVGTDAAVSAV
ncbi:MAG: PAS domain S-box-containing protein, partial [Bradymonadia bacterium]